ncbi:hypothetical protein CHS0354_042409 [Potamilus streckersoni]|uniref:Uncharacterized protein n=1 Tax=Potamilus streckersoni TaxID=2493646 RepID=A0AAE0STX5_9BIVA|nr:hypothetical protein CHS0354_042409 [Potamilus streckersoni]
MDGLMKVSAILMLCEISHAKDLLAHIQGNNAIVCIKELQTDINTNFEINFSGYTSNRHFTNVMLFQQENGKEGTYSINSNYTGRIQRIAMNDRNFSFLLLNATFKDSGNCTLRQTTLEKGNTGVLVARRVLPARPGDRITVSFVFHETNTSSIKIDYASCTMYRTKILYNMSKEVCNSRDIVMVEEMEIEKCALKTKEFSFTFPLIEWLHKGNYFAWDEKGRLLDSIFIDVDENNNRTKAYTINATGIGLIISALLIAVLSAFLVIIAVWKRRTRRVQKTKTYKVTYKNGNPTIANSSRNGCQKFEAKVRMNDTNIYSNGLDCRMPSMKPACTLQSDSKLLLSETVPGDDYVHECDELNTVCLTDCISKESCLCSNAIRNKATDSTVNSSIEYDYVIKHTFMTLRPPAMDPIVTMNKQQLSKIEKFLNSCKTINIKPLSKVLPATLYAKLDKMRTKETKYTCSSVELKDLSLASELSPPCSFENDLVNKSINSPNVSRYGERHMESDSRCISSHVFMYVPELTDLQDSKTRTFPQCLKFDYPRNECSDAYGMEMGHQRSRSLEPLSWDPLNNSNVLKSMKSS